MIFGKTIFSPPATYHNSFQNEISCFIEVPLGQPGNGATRSDVYIQCHILPRYGFDITRSSEILTASRVQHLHISTADLSILYSSDVSDY